MAERKPRLAVSSGDPAGIGPEVTVKAAARPELTDLADLIITGDAALLAATAASLRVPKPAHIEDTGAGLGVVPGTVTPGAGRAAVAAIDRALELVRASRADALVTAPISKEALRAAGFPWPGHTEMLADRTGAADVRMLLTAGPLRMVHVTTHISLRLAIEAVTKARVFRTIQLANEAGESLGIPTPRIGVAGLNPHAGEAGLFGSEDEHEISPAVQEAMALGISAVGPLPADTLIWRASSGEFDLVVVMYHDQGHIPVKLVGFDEGVNLTLGLPIIRTSVDHGTAFDIAGRGIARWASMSAAIRLAAEIVRRRQGQPTLD